MLWCDCVQIRIAMAVETLSLPVYLLQGWWRCRYWAVLHSWERFSWWEVHWHMWPFGFIAATRVHRRIALTKIDFGGEVVCIYAARVYLGTKRCYEGVLWGWMCISLTSAYKIWVSFAKKRKMLFFPPNPSNAYTLFWFFMMMKVTSLIPPFKGRGFFW